MSRKFSYTWIFNIEYFFCLQLSELEQRVIEAEERAEEAEDKVRAFPNEFDDSLEIQKKNTMYKSI